ncbi:MAG: VWA domain-containing protein, partial [Acidobacteriota bacterium]
MRKTVAGSLPRIFFLAGFLLIQVPGITASQEPDSPGIRLSDLVERAEVRLLLLDIVVTDKKGNLITDLTQDEFQLLIDGQPVAIDSFELVSFRRPPSVAGGMTAVPESSVDGERRRENRVILFFDVFNSGNAGLNRMWARAREFLEKGTPVFDKVMIMVYSDRIRIPQPFSADPAEWLRTLDSLDGKLVNRGSYVERESSRMETIDDICRQGPCDKPSSLIGSGSRASYCDSAWSMVQAYTQEEATRALMTLRALNGLVLGLGGLEGRKSVVYFSEGIRRTPGRQYADAARCPACACRPADVFTEQFRLDTEMDKIFRTANSSNVTFHTIDVRSTDRSITTGHRRGVKQTHLSSGRFPNDLFQDAAGRGSGTEDFLDNFAFHTGGLRGVASAKPKKNFKRL